MRSPMPTGREGVFAGGDLQTGPWVAIGAIAAGREAAESIVRYFDKEDMAQGREPIEKEDYDYRPHSKRTPCPRPGPKSGNWPWKNGRAILMKWNWGWMRLKARKKPTGV